MASKFEEFGKKCAHWLNEFSNRGQQTKTTAQMVIEQEKRESDRQVEATLQMEAEEDPVKKLKMENRIANGIYDFSDL